METTGVGEVRSSTVAIEADGCEIPVHLHWSDRPGGTAVVLLHEKLGLDDHVLGLARRLAAGGLATITPDLLARVGGSRDGASALSRGARGVPQAWLVDDLVRSVGGALDLLRVRQYGVVGYSLGGELAWQLADSDDRCQAIVDVHGAAPADAATARDVATLCIFSGLDELEKARAAATAVRRRAISHVEVVPAVRRGFDDPGRPDRFDGAAATRAWRMTVGWLRGHVASRRVRPRVANDGE